MRRRAILAGIASAAAFQPFAGAAQQGGRIYRLGFVVQPPRASYAELLDELGRRGFIEGDNLLADPRGFGLAVEQLEPVAAEVVSMRPDAIFAGGDAAARAAQRATTVIPIITISDDVISNRLTSSLARPGGNLTGISILGPELNGKRQELLIDMVPGIRRIAALIDPATTTPEQLSGLSEAARARGLELSVHPANTREQIALAIDEAHTAGAEALNVFASALLSANRTVIIERTAAANLPAIYQFPEHCEEGGLAGYGARLSLLYRQAAVMLAKALAGAKPNDLPVEQPTKLELCFNLRTSRALGLTVPQALLARADEVIE